MMKNIQGDFDVFTPPLKHEEWVIFQKLISDLSVSQIIWISGYLYSLVIIASNFNSESKLFNTLNFGHKNKGICTHGDVKSSFDSFNVTILSASQTGNARELAKKLYDSCIIEKFNVRLINLANYNVRKISQEQFLLLITSTYGEGEPPEEAVTLYRYLFSKSAPNLQGVSFSVFGLGDRSYEHFSKAAKDFDHRLKQLGASRLYHRVDADIDYQNEAISWRKEIINLLKKKFLLLRKNDEYANCNKSVFDVLNIDGSNIPAYSNTYTKKMPFNARLLFRQKITSRHAVKDVYHLEIDLSNSGLVYQPGDALGVWYENDPALVTELLRYCNFTGEEKIKIQDQLLSFNTVLQKYYELTHNSVSVAKKYASLIKNDELFSLFSDVDKLKKFISSTSIIDMIRYWSPNKLFPEQLLSVLRPLSPRLYSISSSQKEVGEEVHITVGVVRYEVDGYTRSGGASGYLVNRLLEGDELRVFIVPNESFRLPKHVSTAIIMIAAGTGIAPFRSFMQQRLLDGALGKNWLFFGNLSFLDDFLYQREWQEYVKDGVLTNIDTAWSRDQKNKVYVQDKILQRGLEVWKWIEDGAYIYVCGDAKRMACGVKESLIQLGIKYGKMNFEESDLFFEDMRVAHRYQKDVY